MSRIRRILAEEGLLKTAGKDASKMTPDQIKKVLTSIGKATSDVTVAAGNVKRTSTGAHVRGIFVKPNARASFKEEVSKKFSGDVQVREGGHGYFEVVIRDSE